MEAEFTARNAVALQQLRDDDEIEIRAFPDDVLRELRTMTDEVIGEIAAQDPLVARVAESFENFRATVSRWTEISEHAMLRSRGL